MALTPPNKKLILIEQSNFGRTYFECRGTYFPVKDQGSTRYKNVVIKDESVTAVLQLRIRNLRLPKLRTQVM